MRFWGYRDRPVEDVHTVHEVREVGPTQADLDAAYEKGRRDERSRHRSHPFLGLVVAIVALVGGAMIFLSVREGSFSDGGKVVDAQLAAASDNAKVASQDVAQTARTRLHQDTAAR